MTSAGLCYDEIDNQGVERQPPCLFPQLQQNQSIIQCKTSRESSFARFACLHRQWGHPAARHLLHHLQGQLASPAQCCQLLCCLWTCIKSTNLAPGDHLKTAEWLLLMVIVCLYQSSRLADRYQCLTRAKQTICKKSELPHMLLERTENSRGC